MSHNDIHDELIPVQLMRINTLKRTLCVPDVQRLALLTWLLLTADRVAISVDETYLYDFSQIVDLFIESRFSFFRVLNGFNR